MVYRYVPIIRWKRGERVGVQHLSGPARNDVFPLFVLGTDQYVGRKATKKSPVVPAPDAIAAELQSIWGKAPFYLDATALPASTAGHHPLVDIAASMRALGLSLIPATRVTAPGSYQAAVNATAAKDHRGVLLRVDLQEFSAAATWQSAWPTPMAETDLLVDLEDTIGVVAQLGAAVDHVFSNLHGQGQWRTVTMAATSMPENFSGYTAGTSTIPRTEHALWSRLSGISLKYRLDYGDYATVAVMPAPSGIRWGFPINVRYTLPREFLICRGVATTGPGGIDMDPQLVGHSQSIVGWKGRGPLPQCWGDTRIDRIASRIENPQGLEHWVQIGVNRHIELVRSILP